MTKSVTKLLNDLIQVSINGDKGFTEAADHTTDSMLKQVFIEKAQSSKNMVHELQQIINQIGEEPENSGTIAGAINRGWMDIRSMITNNDSYAILAECERQEDVAKAAYTNALKEDLPDDVLVVLERQCIEVIANHDQIRDLRDQYNEEK